MDAKAVGGDQGAMLETMRAELAAHRAELDLLWTALDRLVRAIGDEAVARIAADKAAAIANRDASRELRVYGQAIIESIGAMTGACEALMRARSRRLGIEHKTH